jgi:hypothetical protein
MLPGHSASVVRLSHLTVWPHRLGRRPMPREHPAASRPRSSPAHHRHRGPTCTQSAFTSRETAAAAVAESARRGYLDGQALAGVFAWLRPNDMVGTTWSTTTCSARSRPLLTSCTGTKTPCASPPACTETSCAWRSTTRRHTPVTWRCWARRSTLRASTSTLTSSPASRTTSFRGRTPTAPHSCWEARSGSCCQPAATSRRSSTRPGPPRAPGTGRRRAPGLCKAPGTYVFAS